MSRFAAVQDRVNRACIRHLADASATLAGSPVQAIFQRAFLDAQGVASGSPIVQIQSSSVPANVVGASLVISTGVGAGSYVVQAHEPDGTGMSMLELRKA